MKTLIINFVIIVWGVLSYTGMAQTGNIKIGANLYQGPDIYYDIITSIEMNEKVVVDSVIDNDWCHIVYKQYSGYMLRNEIEFDYVQKEAMVKIEDEKYRIADSIYAVEKLARLQSKINKLELNVSTYEDIVKLYGKAEKVTTTKDSKVADITFYSRIEYEYKSKGLNFSVSKRTKKLTSIYVYSPCSDGIGVTLNKNIYVGMNKNYAESILGDSYSKINNTDKNESIYGGSNILISIACENGLVNKILKLQRVIFEEKYGNKYGPLVEQNKIQIGMTKEMVEDSWGKPNDINRTVGSWGVHEQWIYDSGRYLYFENGKLTSWQD